MENPGSGRDVRLDSSGISRRRFIKITSISTVAAPLSSLSNFSPRALSIVFDPDDAPAQFSPASWAVAQLEEALRANGVAVKRYKDLALAPATDLCIVAGKATDPQVAQLMKKNKLNIPGVPEALGLIPLKSGGKSILLSVGNDVRGTVYAVLELADRVQNNSEALASLALQKPVIEKPANAVRSITRLFTSDIEDKPWYNDKEMWPEYLDMLATQRFNRFNLSLGIGYDFLRNVTDGYFLFAYPFLLSVPGYNVRVPQLPDKERDQNLEMLKFISEQTVARGMQFQLGLWMHGYEWVNSPNPNYTNEGITKENHGPYCRDAVRALLKACPAISGITFRVHGESGVNEGSYDFWKTVFEGVATCGRKVEIDMHSKGMDQHMIDAAVATNMPVSISPKYWAEHIGMPYHQADIRGLEVPNPEKKTSVLMNLSEGSRSFLRYGYGDLLKQDRPYKIIHRIWPGTQRLLLWGDPVTASAHAKAFGFCGSAGVELMEPLSFKGRRGSGIAGDRCGYKDASLKPKWDWEKYLYTLRVFGRLQYNPSSEPDVWQRYLKKQFNAAAQDIELALASATRILPVVLTVHGTSAGNNTYWPEMYTNHPIADIEIPHPYSDSPSPRLFGNVSPMDPQLFLRINDFAQEMLNGQRCGKYTPLEAAQWLEDYADTAHKHLRQAEAKTENKNQPGFRRAAIDIAMQILLGRFFSAKFRTGVLYALYEQSGNTAALEEGLKGYRKARDYWAELAHLARDVYKEDITVGERPHLRGHWLDRLPAMDKDIEFMNKKLASATPDNANDALVKSCIQESLGRPARLSANCKHIQPMHYKNSEPVNIELTADKAKTVKLYYRHVNQGERYQSIEMQAKDKNFRATIPSGYTNANYPIEYYFELIESAKSATLYPGFQPQLNNQPYFLISQV